jgi:hypothetical protein
MSFTIPAAAARLRREVAQAEAALDVALRSVAAVTQTIAAARGDCDVPAHTGQAALIRLQSVQSKLTGAQHDMFRAHDELTRIGREVMGPEEPYKPSYLAPTGVAPDVEAPVSAAA